MKKLLLLFASASMILMLASCKKTVNPGTDPSQDVPSSEDPSQDVTPSEDPWTVGDIAGLWYMADKRAENYIKINPSGKITFYRVSTWVFTVVEASFKKEDDESLTMENLVASHQNSIGEWISANVVDKYVLPLQPTEAGLEIGKNEDLPSGLFERSEVDINNLFPFIGTACRWDSDVFGHIYVGFYYDDIQVSINEESGLKIVSQYEYSVAESRGTSVPRIVYTDLGTFKQSGRDAENPVEEEFSVDKESYTYQTFVVPETNKYKDCSPLLPLLAGTWFITCGSNVAYLSFSPASTSWSATFWVTEFTTKDASTDYLQKFEGTYSFAVSDNLEYRDNYALEFTPTAYTDASGHRVDSYSAEQMEEKWSGVFGNMLGMSVTLNVEDMDLKLITEDGTYPLEFKE